MAHLLLDELVRGGFTVSVRGEKLIVSPGSQLTEKRRQWIRANKTELLAALTAGSPR